MKGYHYLVLVVLFGFMDAVRAQEFDVRSFEADPTDLAAQRYPKTTVNDEPAALIKVVTNIEGMIFDSNIGIVYYERREAEYWLFVPSGEQCTLLMAKKFRSMDGKPDRTGTRSHGKLHCRNRKKITANANSTPVNILAEGHLLFDNEEEPPTNQIISIPRENNSTCIERKGCRASL